MASVLGVLMAIHGLITLMIGSVAVGGAPTPPEMSRLPGAGVFGIVIPTSAWRTIGLVSASTGIAGVVLFFHPYYAIALLVDIAIIAAATSLEATSRNVLGI